MSSDSDDDDDDKRTKSSQTRDAQALNLFEAIIKVNEEKVVQILRQVPSVVRTSDRDGWNAVHYAVWSIAKASGLVEAPVSATAGAERNVDETVLSAARRILFKHLISTSGASLACSNSSGVTVLHLAAWYGLTDVIDAAVQQTGCDVNAKADDRYKTRWIHHRLPGRTLFPRNSDIYRNDFFFNGSDVTPLYVAARANRVDAVKRLLAAGADVNATKLTARPTVGPGGVQVDGPTYSGITALHAAAARGHVDVVRILTAVTNCRLNPATTDGTTPLHCAVEGRHLSVVRALLDARKEHYHRADLILKPSRAATMPEMAASRFDRRYANGKSVNGRTLLDDVTIDVDARKRCMSVENVTALHLAATLDNDEIARELITAGAVVNARSSDGTTPLHMVAQGGSPLIAVLLIKSGADTEAMAAFDRCTRLTPLHLAARAGYSDVIDRLVNIGHANVGAVCCVYGVDGVTALHLAAVYGHAAACRKLVQLGADLNARTATGRTPLHLAVAERREEAVEVLVETDVESRARSSSVPTTSPSPSFSSKTNTASALDDLLHLAVAHSSERIIRALVTTAGYDVNKKLPVSENDIGVTALCMAVESHVTNMVRLLLELGADPNADMNSLSRGVTALHAAAEQGSVDVAQLLVAAGADVNSMADYGHLRQVTPIHLAVVNRHAEMVSFLSGAGADVNHAAVEVFDGKESRGSGGTTGGESQFSPLYLAVKNSDVATVRALLTARCNVSRSPRHDGWTPLHAACENGSADIVQELLAAGSDVTTSAAFNDSRGVLPLHQAAQEGHADIVEALVAAGSDINARKVWRDETGIAPLLLAAEAGHVKVVKRLIQLGADVNAAKSTGWTALHWAARNGSVDLAKMLLSAGAKVNCQASADRGGSPLDQAAERGHIEIIRLLISFGAGYRPDGVGAKMTALHRAAACGQLAVVRLLTTDELCNAEMLSALDRNGFTALHYAAQNGHVDIVRTLIARHSPLVKSSISSSRIAHNVTSSSSSSIKTTDVLPLHLAATAGHSTICRFLVAAGCPVDSRTDYFRPGGATALHLSVVGGHLATVSALIELGADVNAVNADGLSAMHLAAGCVESGNGGLDLLDRLLHAGASPDIGAALRPIHVAARFGITAVVRRLIRAGCDVNARTASGSRALLDITEGSVTCDGMTALHLAALKGRIDIVRALIRCTPTERIDLAVLNDDGLTAYDLAVRLGRTAIVKYLSSSSSNERRSMVATDSQVRGKMRHEL